MEMGKAQLANHQSSLLVLYRTRELVRIDADADAEAEAEAVADRKSKMGWTGIANVIGIDNRQARVMVN
jgi:hypothetical protein